MKEQNLFNEWFGSDEPIDTELRDTFQQMYSAKEIKAIEEKFVNFSLRGSRADHPAKALTPEERRIYADYLESKGHNLGAASFRNYVDKPEEIKEKKRGRKQ